MLGKIRTFRRQQNTVSRRRSGDPPITHRLIFSKPPYCKILVKIRWTFCLKLSPSLILYPVPRCLMLLASAITYTLMTSSEFIKPNSQVKAFHQTSEAQYVQKSDLLPCCTCLFLGHFSLPLSLFLLSLS